MRGATRSARGGCSGTIVVQAQACCTAAGGRTRCDCCRRCEGAPACLAPAWAQARLGGAAPRAARAWSVRVWSGAARGVRRPGADRTGMTHSTEEWRDRAVRCAHSAISCVAPPLPRRSCVRECTARHAARSSVARAVRAADRRTRAYCCHAEWWPPRPPRRELQLNRALAPAGDGPGSPQGGGGRRFLATAWSQVRPGGPDQRNRNAACFPDFPRALSARGRRVRPTPRRTVGTVRGKGGAPAGGFSAFGSRDLRRPGAGSRPATRSAAPIGAAATLPHAATRDQGAAGGLRAGKGSADRLFWTPQALPLGGAAT
jgi:hypothetical protein